MKQDRFLLAILAAIGLLVVVALALFFIRQSSLDYGPEDTPAGVVRNYVIAIEKEDYQRAYGYLNENDKPDFERFQRSFLSGELLHTSAAVRVAGERITNGEATVNLTIIHGGGGPFGDVWREQTTALLVLQEGTWKLSQLPYPYWSWNWYPQPRDTP
jgi:hypothetical protein